MQKEPENTVRGMRKDPGFRCLSVSTLTRLSLMLRLARAVEEINSCLVAKGLSTPCRLPSTNGLFEGKPSRMLLTPAPCCGELMTIHAQLPDTA